MNTKIILYLFLICCPLLLVGQVSFSAICNQREVAIGQRFEVQFQLKNAKIIDLKPPSFVGFEVVGNSSGQTVSFVNGKSNMIHTVNYALMAKRKGNFKIGKAEIITSQKKVLRSKVIKIKVIAPDKTNQGSLESRLAGKVFIRTEISNEKPVVGEQLIVDIKLYYQINLEHALITKEPIFNDFFSHHLRSYNSAATLETIKGKTYNAKVLRRIVVFPSKSGPLLIEPAMVEIGVPVNGEQSIFNPFFQVATATLKSMPIEVNVRALDGVPSNFSGVVGKFKMETQIAKTNINSDDVIQLKIQILGEGDVKQISAPKLGVDKRYFDEFDPNIMEDMREGAGLLGGKKIFEYVLTPKVVGDFTIQPSFVYFDVKKRKFITLDTIININISKGSNNLPTVAELSKINLAQKEASLGLIEKIAFKLPQTTTTFHTKNSFFLGSSLFWVLAMLPLLLLVGVFYQKNKTDQIAAIPIMEIKKQKAGSEATKRLKNAKSIQKKGDAKAFYNEISKALLGFVGDKYNIPMVELTKKNVKNRLIEQQLAVDKIDNLVAILQTCEMALFAGMFDQNAMQKVYQDSEELIKLMEK